MKKISHGAESYFGDTYYVLYVSVPNYKELLRIGQSGRPVQWWEYVRPEQNGDHRYGAVARTSARIRERARAEEVTEQWNSEANFL